VARNQLEPVRALSQKKLTKVLLLHKNGLSRGSFEALYPGVLWNSLQINVWRHECTYRFTCQESL
jgi:hypothetical protein